MLKLIGTVALVIVALNLALMVSPWIFVGLAVYGLWSLLKKEKVTKTGV